jgi:hypothetical protein
MVKTLKRFKKREEEGAKNKHGRKEWKAYMTARNFKPRHTHHFHHATHNHPVTIALYSIEDVAI